MGNFSSKPKVIVVPGVTARIHRHPIYGSGQDDMETMENIPLTSREFYNVFAKCHLDFSMFFDNANKKTFTINPSPGDKGITFENHTEKCYYKLVFYRDQDPAVKKMMDNDLDSWLVPFVKAEEDECINHRRRTSTQSQMNSDPDSWSVNTLVETGVKEANKELRTPPMADMEHRYDPKTRTLFLDHRYTCNVNALDRSRRWIVNGIEQSDLASTVPTKTFTKFGDVYGLRCKSTTNHNTKLIEKREARELAGCSPIFL